MNTHVNYFIKSIFFFLLCFYSSNVLAERPKLYVVTDKSFYKPTEFLQIQIFLTNAANPNQTVYAELFDCNGNKLIRKMFPLQAGSGAGTIQMPDQFGAAYYILNCYTLDKGALEADCNKKIFIENHQLPVINETAQEPKLEFFIEGGTFVADMDHNILITCMDESGILTSTAGKIIDDANRIFSRFFTDGAGFARINFNPEANVKYYIVTEPKKGMVIKKGLPLADKDGVTLGVRIDKDSLTYKTFSLSTNENKLDYKLEILHDGLPEYKADINFQSGLSVVQETLSSKDFSEGFLTLRLTDKANKVVAQRLVFNNLKPGSNTLLKIVDTVSKKFTSAVLPDYVNGSACIRVNAINKNDSTTGNAPNTTLKDISTLPANTISFNDFLISRNTQPIPTVQGDLNAFLTLKGTVYNTDNKPVKNKKINLVFLYKDMKKDYLAATTDRNGDFEIRGLVFYDTVTVYSQLADNSNEKNYIHTEMKVIPEKSFNNISQYTLDFNCGNKIADFSDSLKKSASTGNLTDSSKNEKTLQEVTVAQKKEKEKTASEKFIEQNVSAQNNQSNSKRFEFDFIANPQVVDNTPILEFLRGRVGGLSIGVTPKGEITISNASGDGIGVYLDDMDVTEDLSNITYLTVNEIALVRYYSVSLKPRSSSTKTKYNFSGKVSSDAGGDLMIYTKRGFSSKNSNQAVKGMDKTRIVGYDSDNPASLLPVSPQESQSSYYWEPNWMPQKEKTIYIRLSPTGEEKQLELIIEGINTAQSPFIFTKKLVFN